jgi:flagellin-like protein
MSKKKAEMGVGTLIIFIAMLLVAAVAAAVLIQTVGSLQEQSLQTGMQARSQISSSAETVEVSATDGRDTTVEYFQQLMKLAPGSDPIKLDQTLLSFNTKDVTATLIYRGTTGTCFRNNQTGYYTRKAEVVSSAFNITDCYTFAEDMDYDGNYNDQICVLDSTHLHLDFTGGSSIFTIDSIASASSTPVTLNVAEQAVNRSNSSFGRIEISGTTNLDNNILADMVTVTPYHEGDGYFTVTYLQQGTNWVNGNLQRGDLVKLCYEAPEALEESEDVRINFVPKIGVATLTEFATPDVMSTERVYMYP